jgi:nitroimidazol reductase NimA-like FMN-containing flavoprotein (pyridoxamine 5'-phosphate oxidase superfamily)
MRRKEKEITDRREIDAILNEARVCRIAFARDNEPYVVPLFFGYDGRCLYFHTACEGKKLDFLAANRQVCFEVERNVTLVSHDAQACKWSAHFESVIGYGRVIELVDGKEREQGLNQIMLHYSGREWQYDPSHLQGTRVWCVEIESLTGKRSA